MDTKMTEKLFSENGLHYNAQIHSNLVLKILSVLLDRASEKTLEQSEYLIQSTINDYLTGHLRNTDFSAATEVKAFDQKRIDNAVIHISSGSTLVHYEVKSYIKLAENKVNAKLVYNDIVKLAIKKKELPFSETYLLIAGREKVIKNALVEDKTLLLPHKYIDRANKSSISFDINFFETQLVNKTFIEQAKHAGIKKISISPSRWKMSNGMAVLTWRINKV